MADQGSSRSNEPNPVPSKVLDPAQPLLIDAELTRLTRAKPPCIRESLRKDAKYVGRRCLEVAILAAVSAVEDDPPRNKWGWKWERQRDKAKEAAGAISAMLRTLSLSSEQDDLVRGLVNIRLGGPIAGNRSRMTSQARKDLETLRRAEILATQLAADAERRRREFVVGRKNPGQPDQREFVRILAEGWIFLMGQRPGSSPDENSNPFLRFASAAWTDWKGNKTDPPALVGALRHFRSQLGDHDVAALTRNGPDWLGVTKPHLNF